MSGTEKPPRFVTVTFHAIHAWGTAHTQKSLRKNQARGVLLLKTFITRMTTAALLPRCPTCEPFSLFYALCSRRIGLLPGPDFRAGGDSSKLLVVETRQRVWSRYRNGDRWGGETNTGRRPGRGAVVFVVVAAERQQRRCWNSRRGGRRGGGCGCGCGDGGGGGEQRRCQE